MPSSPAVAQATLLPTASGVLMIIPTVHCMIRGA
jgi:hypothetical protein